MGCACLRAPRKKAATTARRSPQTSGVRRSSSMQVPPHISQWLDGWGVPLRRRTQDAADAALAKLKVQRSSSSPMSLRVGTDCSGAEAPIWSLRAMQIGHSHVFSSDIGKAPRLIIAANTKPRVFYSDLLKRKTESTPAVDLYVAGFPCTPFSMLHNKTKLFKEKAAKPFFKMVQYLRRPDSPPAAVLENVSGILRVKDRILQVLRSAGYSVVLLPMCPTHLGEPLARPRIYFLMVKSTFAKATEKSMETVARSTWSSLKAGCAASLSSRCLPRNHVEVSRVLAARRAKFVEAKRRNFASRKQSPSWPARHRAFMASGGPAARSRSAVARSYGSRCTADELLLCNERERKVWSILTGSIRGHMTADLSQSIDRVNVRSDGKLSTVTPGSIMASSELGRTIIPVEKLMLHAFPVHRMVIPKEITDKDLESLGGNTMHVMCVGVAISLVLKLVDWDKVRRLGGHAETKSSVTVNAVRSVKRKLATQRLQKTKRQKRSRWS